MSHENKPNEARRFLATGRGARYRERIDMRFAFGWIGALLGSALLAGCSMEAADSYQATADQGKTSEPTIDATIAFEGPTAIDVGPGESRELAVFTGDDDSTRRLAAFLQASPSGFHRLQPDGLAPSDRAAFFSQSDASLSRKKLQPLIKKLFSTQD